MTTSPTTFRLDPETDRRLDELAAALGVSRTDALRLAVRKLHRAEGLDANKTPAKGRKGR